MTDITINADDRLVLYGCGLFETMKVGTNGVEVPYLHWARMKGGGRILQIAVPGYKVWLAEITGFVSDQPQHPPYALRLTYSGGLPDDAYSQKKFFHIREIPYTSEQYREGMDICFLSQPRASSILTQAKSTHNAENILAKKEARERGAAEGIWLNKAGCMTEGTMSNLFFVKRGVLFTPSLDCGCLAGTRRTLVILAARRLGIPVIEGAFLPSALLEADAVFMTNALMGIMPVKRIERKTYETSANSCVLALERCFKALL